MRGKHRNPNIYRVTCPDGSVLTGTAVDLSAQTGINDNYLRAAAKLNRPISGSYTVRLIRRGNCNITTGKIYVAEHPDEDPIIGPASELALLTGMTDVWIRQIAVSGRSSRDGWRVRLATEEEAATWEE